MKRILLVIGASLLLTACATQPLLKETASGKPEGDYPGKTVNQVQEALILMCNTNGLRVYEAEKSIVTCGKQSGSVLHQMAVGNASSTMAESKVRFTIAAINKTPRVWADMWIESQMVMGQTNTMPLDGNVAKNQIQELLDNLTFN